MPKDAFEITSIAGGMVCGVSDHDVRPDTMKYLMNVNPFDKPGAISPFKDDVNRWQDSAQTKCQANILFNIRYDEGYYNIYNEYTNGNLYSLKDEIGNSATLVWSTTLSDLELVNDKVRACNTSGDVKFFGHLNNDRLGVEQPGLTLEEGRLLPFELGDSNGFYKACSDRENEPDAVSHYAAIKFGSNRLYMETSTHYLYNTVDDYVALGLSNPIEFSSTQAICYLSKGCFAVYDNDSTNSGKVYIFKFTGGGTTLSLVGTITLEGMVLRNSNEQTITDMERTIIYQGGTGYIVLWFSVYDRDRPRINITRYRLMEVDDVNDEENAGTTGRYGYCTFLWRADFQEMGINDPGSGYFMENPPPSLTIRNVSPDMCATGSPESTHLGRFYTSGTGYFQMEMFYRPLFANNNGGGQEWIGYLCNFIKGSGDSSPLIVTYGASGDGYSQGSCLGLNALFVRQDSAQGTINNKPYRNGALTYAGRRILVSSYNLTEYDSGKIIGGKNLSVVKVLAPEYPYPTGWGRAVIINIGKYAYVWDGSFRDDSSEMFESLCTDFWSLSGEGWNAIRCLSGREQVSSLETDKSSNLKVSRGTLFPLNNSGSQTKTIAVFSSNGTKSTFILRMTNRPNTITDENITATSGNFVEISENSNVEAMGNRAGRTYNYRVALVYDGNQYSPLSDVIETFTPENVDDGCLLNAYIEDTLSGINKRVTGIVFFKSEEGGVTGSYESIPREITRIDLTLPSSCFNYTNVNETFKVFSAKDRNELGATYEDLTGVPFIAKTVTPNYKNIYYDGAYSYVWNCLDFDGIRCDKMLFQSEAGRPDQFNLMSKFVLLKDVPVAVARLEDKIYAFTASGVYLIDRNKFVELGFDESITVSHKNWVATTPIGIIVINDRSIYLNSGDGFRDIGESIGRSTDIQIAWANKIALSGSNCATGYDSYYRCIVVSATYSGAIPNVCFMITRDGSIFPFATSYLPRCFSYNGKHKRTMYGNTRGLSTLMDSSANRDWTITTQCLRLGRDLMYKKFYKAYVIAESSPTRIAVSNEMGTDLVGDVTHDANTKLYEYKIRSSDDWKQRGIYIYISGTAIVDTIGVVHRQYRSPR